MLAFPRLGNETEKTYTVNPDILHRICDEDMSIDPAKVGVGGSSRWAAADATKARSGKRDFISKRLGEWLRTDKPPFYTGTEIGLVNIGNELASSWATEIEAQRVNPS